MNEGAGRYHRIFLATLIVVWVVFLFTGSVRALGSNRELEFTILHTNDTHSSLLPRQPPGDDDIVGGFARLAAAVRRTRAACGDDRSVLVSAGDFLGGSPFGWLALKGFSPQIQMFDRMGYDLITLGNHEFDFGPTILARYLEGADSEESPLSLSIVASNLSIPGDHPLDEVPIESTAVIPLNDGQLRVGFFGLIGEAAQTVTADPGDIIFVDPVEAAERAVCSLRQQDVDVIVALTHSGLKEDRELAREVSDIDVIVGGHCHTALMQPVVQGDTIIVQAGSSASYLGRCDLIYDPAQGEVRLASPGGKAALVPISEDLTPDLKMQSLVDEATEQLNSLVAEMTEERYVSIYDEVAQLQFSIDNEPEGKETPMANFVTDAISWAVAEQTGEHVDFAFQAAGQLRSGLTRGTLGDDADLLCVYDVIRPVGLGMGEDNSPGFPVASMYLTGEEVKRVLELSPLLREVLGNSFFLHHSGLRVRMDPSRAVLFWVPVLDLPIPTGRAVLEVERYTEEGTWEEWSPSDETLYHVACDYHIVSFIPKVGDMLPQFAVQPKDRWGDPLEDLSSSIVRKSGGEQLKVWQAVLNYAGSFPGEGGLSVIPEKYAETDGRILEVKTVPLWLWVLAVLGAVTALIVLGIRHLMYRRR